jgi:hypothetical protein
VDEQALSVHFRLAFDLNADPGHQKGIGFP